MGKKEDIRADKIVAEDIMNEDVQTINQDMTVGDLAHIMLRKGVNGFPVLDQKSSVVGIVTFTDLFKMIHELESADQKEDQSSVVQSYISEYRKIPISEIMTKYVVSISPKTTLSEIIDMTVNQKIHTFPVLNEGKLVGILNREDVLNATFAYA